MEVILNAWGRCSCVYWWVDECSYSSNLCGRQMEKFQTGIDTWYRQNIQEFDNIDYDSLGTHRHHNCFRLSLALAASIVLPVSFLITCLCLAWLPFTDSEMDTATVHCGGPRHAHRPPAATGTVSCLVVYLSPEPGHRGLHSLADQHGFDH